MKKRRVETPQLPTVNEIHDDAEQGRNHADGFSFDTKGPLLIEILPRVKGSVLLQYPGTFASAIKVKSTGMLSFGVILLYDNARPHAVTRTLSKLAQFQKMCWITHHKAQTFHHRTFPSPLKKDIESTFSFGQKVMDTG
ncbi:hypothetical protein CEXT_189171 [Caerostris extrusa]|uniref:Uncharacterized protein n=1 Tax=Caerostris extrusa TaxID=172846 RepID=A0AAV4MSZ2_CAEEX|nr:hypothetical protein CEXT_189171 [Caerostris extrusa]